MSWLDDMKFDSRGLVPVVAQDAVTAEVLMLAYANRAALEATRRTGQAHYWSRSRDELWKKGATSGNRQPVDEVRVDCDGDAVLYRVRQSGCACHTGTRSCFQRLADGDHLAETGAPGDVFATLAATIRQRDETRPAGSYTSYLLREGVDKVLKKVGEESAEVIIAAKNPGTDELASEAADLLYHLLVLLHLRRLPFDAVRAKLAERGAGRAAAASAAVPTEKGEEGDVASAE